VEAALWLAQKPLAQAGVTRASALRSLQVTGAWCGPLGGKIAVVARAGLARSRRTLVGNEARASLTDLSIHIYIQ